MRRSIGRITVAVLGLVAVQLAFGSAVALSDGNGSPLPASPPTTAASSSPIPFALGAPPVLSAARNVIVLLGAGDAATAGRLIATLANRLRAYRLVNDAYVVPEPTWTLSDFTASCKSDQTLAGALLTTLVAATASQKEWTAYRDFHFQLAGATMWIACTAPKPASNDGTGSQSEATYIVPCVRNVVRHLPQATIPEATLKPCTLTTPKPPSDAGTPEVAWISPVVYAADKPVRVWEIQQLLTSALAVFSVYETFRPSITTMSGSTTSFPVSTPIPRSGELSSVTSGSQTVSNPESGLGAIATSLYAQGLNYTSAVGALPISDEQSYRAAVDVVTGIIKAMNCRYKPALTQPNPSATPFDSFPAYNFASVSYPRRNPKEQSAPFCDQTE
jgi:hypothetical protein